jgi:hypothetical protein
VSISHPHTHPPSQRGTHPSAFRFTVEVSVGDEQKQCNKEKMDIDDWDKATKWEGELATSVTNEVMKAWGPGWEAREYVLTCKHAYNITRNTIDVGLTSNNQDTEAVCGNVLLFVSAECSVGEGRGGGN